MPAMSSKLLTLSLLNNLSPPLIGSDGYPKERQINRSILLDVSPDREELLSSTSVKDIRERLMLRIHSPHGHWLHSINHRRDTKPACGHATTRYSLFGRSPEKENAAGGNKVTRCRRALSGSSAYSGTVARDLGLSDVSIDIWSSRSLSTQDKLISPRPLGPTHILVVSQLHRDRDSDANSSADNVVELPVNDLLFILNVPNLRTSRRNGQSTSALPRRLHKEMPRVALRVPALETFPDVVIYLHTKDRDDLFNQLIPEWIRGVICPHMPASVSPSTLKPLADASTRVRNTDDELSGSQCLSTLGFGLGLNVASKARGSVKRLFRPIPTIALEHHPGSTRPKCTPAVVELALPDSMLIQKRQNDQRCKSIATAAKEIADAFSSFGSYTDKVDLEAMDVNPRDLRTPSDTHPGDNGFPSDVLKLIAAKLNALAENFTYLGYFERALWLELNMYRDVIAEALKLAPQTPNQI
ncbi:hypothetical protein D9619_009959 [Psilocybe cf. subviscida]|uniref:Uncharacterized protein n=1 Tax=Psilocybe cf. subviscida TaxID=2480587 RepID=A0A8H5F6E0_9AGAR|nr:hypothetical protein D9619_009959 [Psilocybe cf. subviscida]